MSPVRHWNVGQLLAAYLAALVGYLTVRWLLQAGVYEARMEAGTVRIDSGAWSAAFADLVGLVVAAGILAIVVGLTVVWIGGSTERRRLSSMTEAPHRRPLV